MRAASRRAARPTNRRPRGSRRCAGSCRSRSTGTQLTDGTETATLRGWERRDWGDDGATMHWCCTEGPEAYVGDRQVVESLADELIGVVGEPVYVELRRRLR